MSVLDPSFERGGDPIGRASQIARVRRLIASIDATSTRLLLGREGYAARGAVARGKAAPRAYGVAIPKASTYRTDLAVRERAHGYLLHPE